MKNIADKILPLESLASRLGQERAKGKKIVHCHGVFDLLHIGHIKHLHAARALGDVLVVTITQDGFVDKGPYRPAFTEQLRAEALAALECVDYVAINRWPTAVETIGLLKPDLFVKGATNEAGPRDHTGAILHEEAAVNAVGGQLQYTVEDTFSATTLINRHIDVFEPRVRAYLEEFRSRFSEEDVLGYLRKMRDLRVLLIGEAIVDEYLFCYVMNKANKDPILAAKYLYGEKYPGGILAVANHLAGFCDRMTCLTYLGDTEPQTDFVREHLDANVALRHVVKPQSPTIVKRRYLEEYLGVKLIEVDFMNDDPLPPVTETAFCDLIAELAPQHDVVVVADYGHGLLTDKAKRLLCEKAPYLALNVQVNPGNYGFSFLSQYPRADFATLDEPEARLEMKKKQMDIEATVPILVEQLNCKRLLLTRGQKGTLGYDPEHGISLTPVFSTRLMDRIGAGDACFALTAPCAALGAPAEILGFLGNLAGATACGIMGHRSFIDPASYLRGITSLLK